MLGEAENLKLILTAGVGSDHIDLGEAAEKNITVAEITGSNTVSVAEHAVMQVLALVRNFIPAYKDVVDVAIPSVLGSPAGRPSLTCSGRRKRVPTVARLDGPSSCDRQCADFRTKR